MQKSIFLQIQRSHDLFSSQIHVLKIPYDDYRFCAILRIGPIISNLKEPLKYQIIDSCNSNGVLTFPMKVLHASQILNNYPQFETTGLLAWWKLVSSNNETWLVLDTPLWPKDKSEVRKSLLDSASSHFVRKRYETFFETQ